MFRQLILCINFADKEQANVFCLVRANNDDEAFQRFENIFKNIFGERFGAKIQKFSDWKDRSGGIQIIPIAGHLGITYIYL